MQRNVDVVIIGAGTAGLNAMGQVRRVTKNFVLINGGPLGTTCARVGCMPSKAFIQVAEDFHRKSIFDREGIVGEENLTVDMAETLEHVRHLRDILVDRVQANSTDHLDEDHFIEGYAEFVEPQVVRVNNVTLNTKAVVIATGTHPVVPAPWKAFGDRVLTTNTFFEQEDLPQDMAVIGLGMIGLELGQAMCRLGVNVTGVDMLDTIGGLTDPAVNQKAIELIGKEFPLWLGQAAEVSEEDGKLKVTCGEKSVLVDKILASLGRRPNLEHLHLERLGVALRDDGVPEYNPNTMQATDLPIYLAGDVNTDRAILHEAGNEGRIAGYNAARQSSVAFERKTPLGIAFTDPNITVAGASLNQLKENEIVIGETQWGPLGRALVMGRNKGLLRIYADKSDGRLLGATMAVYGGEHLAHLIAWCIQQNLTVHEMLRMPFYHPVIEEGLQGALRDAIGKLSDTETDYPVDLQPMAS